MIAVIYLPPPLPVLLPASPILSRPSRSCLRPNPSAHRAGSLSAAFASRVLYREARFRYHNNVSLTRTESPPLLPKRRESPITSTTHTSTFLALLRHRGNSLTIYGYAGRKAPRHSPTLRFAPVPAQAKSANFTSCRWKSPLGGTLPVLGRPAGRTLPSHGGPALFTLSREGLDPCGRFALPRAHHPELLNFPPPFFIGTAAACRRFSSRSNATPHSNLPPTIQCHPEPASHADRRRLPVRRISTVASWLTLS